MNLPEAYIKNIKNRSGINYFRGYIARLIINLKYSYIRKLARHNGASIGKNVILPLKLAKRANENLSIGDDVICDTYHLDLRAPIQINSCCIINRDVSILRVSHHIDNDNKFTTRYYPKLIIDSYSWLCTGCKILPSVNMIAMGTVVSAYSVLFKNTNKMDVIGNDGEVLRKHNSLFTELVIPSLKGGDFNYYRKVRK